MPSQPLVSVLISCYNHEKFVYQCIKSVLQQTYNNIELIVLDDGSKDRSPEIIKALAEKEGFYFEAQKNLGLSASLNKAISLSKGKYLASIGSDDIMFLDRIEKQVAYMEEHPEMGFCAGNILKIDAQGNLLANQKMKSAAIIQDFDEVFLGETRKQYATPAPTLFFSRKALLEAGGFHPKIPLEDLYIELKIASLGYPIGILNDVLAYYRVHPNNIHKNLNFMVENLLKIYAEFSDHPLYPKARAKILSAMLVKAAKKDRALAKKILKMIPLKHYSCKTFKGIFRYVTRLSL